jgi:hypothetical protein
MPLAVAPEKTCATPPEEMTGVIAAPPLSVRTPPLPTWVLTALPPDTVSVDIF